MAGRLVEKDILELVFRLEAFLPTQLSGEVNNLRDPTQIQQSIEVRLFT